MKRVTKRTIDGVDEVKVNYAKTKLQEIKYAGLINDHTGELESDRVGALVILGNGEICPFYLGTPYQSFNPIYVGEDGKVHLDKYSTGGCIIDDDFDHYNKSVISECYAVKYVIWRDGKVTTPVA